MCLPWIGGIRFDRRHVVFVRVAVIATIAMIVGMSFRDFAARAEIHPHREAEDQHGGGEVEVWLGVLGIPLPSVMQGQCRQHPDEQ